MNKHQGIAIAVSLIITLLASGASAAVGDPQPKADGTKRSCSKEEMEKCRRAAEEAAAMESKKPSDVAADRVSFYEVGLVCKAAPKIGCGSRAKPVLVSLTANSRVTGAWLNEAGTRLAIAWKEGANPLTADQLDAVLDPHGVALQPVSEANRNDLLATFAGNSGWFDAASVDRLSEQESGVIAKRLVKLLAAKTSVTGEQQSRLNAAFEKTLRSRLTGSGIGKLNEQKLIADVNDQLLMAATPHLDSTALSALKAVIALGYRPLPNED